MKPGNFLIISVLDLHYVPFPCWWSLLMAGACQCHDIVRPIESLGRLWVFSGRETLSIHSQRCYQSISHIGSWSVGHWSRQDKKEKKRNEFPKIINIRNFYHGGYHIWFAKCIPDWIPWICPEKGTKLYLGVQNVSRVAQSIPNACYSHETQ